MQLSSYVYQTTHQGQEVYYHLVLRKWLPVTTPPETLRSELFLQGSEEQAVWSKLTAKQEKCQFIVVPTWECNLRCNHCTVLHKLTTNDQQRPQVEPTAAFIERFATHFNYKLIGIDLIGGEPLLAHDFINALLDRITMPLSVSMTTNLATELTESHLKFLHRLENFAVSIDGLPEFHNKQRYAFTGDFDPFLRTWENLKTIIRAGLIDKLMIKAAIRDEFYTDEHAEAFYRLFMGLGIPIEKIRVGTIHPTAWKPEPEPSFLQFLRRPKLISDVCCKYRHHNLVISADSIYTDFHTWTRLGSLAEPVDVIMQRHFDSLTQMPVLTDPKCQACPVLGMCWGGCTNGSSLVGDRPSNYCDQSGLIAEVHQRALAGTLVSGENNETENIHD